MRTVSVGTRPVRGLTLSQLANLPLADGLSVAEVVAIVAAKNVPPVGKRNHAWVYSAVDVHKTIKRYQRASAAGG